MTIILGIIFFVSYLIFKIFSIIFTSNSTGITAKLYEISNSNIPESLISFSIIFFAAGLIFYFFSRQFAKLAEIADEIEKMDDFKEN
jgi:TRAP-type C4-dicarboxylate transport system permease small subunit